MGHFSACRMEVSCRHAQAHPEKIGRARRGSIRSDSSPEARIPTTPRRVDARRTEGALLECPARTQDPATRLLQAQRHPGAYRRTRSGTPQPFRSPLENARSRAMAQEFHGVEIQLGNLARRGESPRSSEILACTQHYSPRGDIALSGSSTHVPSTIPAPKSIAGSRSLAPVFVLGCVRSGTTLLYHMLLSAGNFAIYRTESAVLNLLEPRFGDLSVPRNKQRLLNAWCESRLFTATGLERESITAKVMNECRNGGDFLRIVMSQMAVKQGVQRWADTTPEHLLYLHRIKETIPEALVIHIIRDGRDVALSTDKQGYIRRLPWDRLPSKMAAGLYWDWMVSKGRRDGRDLGNDYIEVHFEDLVSEPRQTLAHLGRFIEQELDYDQILRVGIGSV